MKVVEDEISWLSKILSKPKFTFYFGTQSQRVPGTTIKIAEYVQKFFSLAFHHLTIFDSLAQRDFEFLQKLKLVISDVFRGFLGITEALTHTVAPYWNVDGL